jgi:plasmid stabilization system protein ParE
MKIIFKPTFLKELKHILEFIALDKPSASMKFKNELKQSINLLSDNPYQYMKSIYFDDENIRDMVHKGYTIIYRIKPKSKIIEIIRIFNRNKPY